MIKKVEEIKNVKVLNGTLSRRRYAKFYLFHFSIILGKQYSITNDPKNVIRFFLYIIMYFIILGI